MSDPSRPRASLRTAVVWDVLQEALGRPPAGPERPEGAPRTAGGDAGAGGVLDVLDIGGGTGNFAVPVARLGHRVTVVDPSPDALFALERRAAEAGVTHRVRGVQGDAHGLREVVERGSQDVVLCHGVLEHLDDPAEGMRAVADALKAHGTLSLLAAGRNGAVLARAIAGHFTEAQRGLADPVGRWGDGDPLPRRFTAEDLTALVGAVGLEVASVHGVRVFSDLVPGVLMDTEPGAQEALLRLELAAARLPAFHAVATQLHVLARRG